MPHCARAASVNVLRHWDLRAAVLSVSGQALASRAKLPSGLLRQNGASLLFSTCYGTRGTMEVEFRNDEKTPGMTVRIYERLWFVGRRSFDLIPARSRGSEMGSSEAPHATSQHQVGYLSKVSIKRILAVVPCTLQGLMMMVFLTQG